MVATVINEEVGLIVLAVLCGLGLPFEMLSARAVLLTGLLYAQTLILIWKSEGVVSHLLAELILAIEVFLVVFTFLIRFEFGRHSHGSNLVFETAGKLVDFDIRT